MSNIFHDVEKLIVFFTEKDQVSKFGRSYSQEKYRSFSSLSVLFDKNIGKCRVS